MNIPCNLLFSVLPLFTPHTTNIEQAQRAVIEMVATHDDTHSFMPLAPSYKEKKELMQSLLPINPQGQYVIKNTDEIVAYLRSVKMKSPSHELVEEFKIKGPVYRNLVAMLLSYPDLPQTSQDFVLRVSLIVAKHYRKQGLGKKLMEHIETKAKEDKEISAITLDVQETNEAAIKLYESLGYQRVVHNKEVGLIAYKKDLKSLN